MLFHKDLGLHVGVWGFRSLLMKVFGSCDSYCGFYCHCCYHCYCYCRLSIICDLVNFVRNGCLSS